MLSDWRKPSCWVSSASGTAFCKWFGPVGFTGPGPQQLGTTISSFKSQSTVLLQKRVERPRQVDDGILPQVERYKYPGIIFSSEERFEWEIDRQIVAASAFERTLQVEELNGEAEFSICSLICISSLTYGQELWVRTERLKSYSRFSKNSKQEKIIRWICLSQTNSNLAKCIQDQGSLPASGKSQCPDALSGIVVHFGKCVYWHNPYSHNSRNIHCYTLLKPLCQKSGRNCCCLYEIPPTSNG